jgi:hypothetical protein
MNEWTIIRLEQYITLVEKFVVEIMLNLIEVKIYTNIYSKSLLQKILFHIKYTRHW